MSFNPSKCNVIHVSRKKKPLLHTYHIKDTDLEAVDIATYLGVEVSKELTWHKQVSKVAAKGNRVLGFVRRNITTTSQCIKELAYKTLVRPVMEYSASVWSPHYKKLKRLIEMVQRRAARFVLHRYERKASVTDMILQLKWDTLEEKTEGTHCDDVQNHSQPSNDSCRPTHLLYGEHQRARHEAANNISKAELLQIQLLSFYDSSLELHQLRSGFSNHA